MLHIKKRDREITEVRRAIVNKRYPHHQIPAFQLKSQFYICTYQYNRNYYSR